MAVALKGSIMHHQRYRNFFWFFKMADWILKLKFLSATHFRDAFHIIMPDSLEIRHTVAEMLQFFLHFSGEM